MSIARDPSTVNSKLFSTVHTIQLKQQTEAFNWTRTKPNIKFRTINGTKHYFITPSSKPEVKENDIDEFLKHRTKLNWQTFSSYQNYRSRLWLVIMEEDWTNATYTCSHFLKQYMCKHVLGIAIIKHKYRFPDEAKTIPLTEKRKRGGLAKSKKALVVQ